jgi:peptide deformylase
MILQLASQTPLPAAPLGTPLRGAESCPVPFIIVIQASDEGFCKGGPISARIKSRKKEMAVREILIIGDPILTQRSEPVDAITEEIVRLAQDMVETVHAAPGVGLAAPQVGVKKRVIVVDLSVGEHEDALYVLINPEIVFKEGEAVGEEGCLSVPEIKEKVSRPYRVVVRGLDLEGRAGEIEGEDLLARAFCHEIDHLDGILFVEKLSALKRALIKKKFKKNAAAAKKA